MTDALDARLANGTAFWTIYLSRDDTGSIDLDALRTVVDGASDQQLLQSLADAVVTAELVFMRYFQQGASHPSQVLADLAAYRASE